MSDAPVEESPKEDASDEDSPKENALDEDSPKESVPDEDTSNENAPNSIAKSGSGSDLEHVSDENSQDNEQELNNNLRSKAKTALQVYLETSGRIIVDDSDDESSDEDMDDDDDIYGALTRDPPIKTLLHSTANAENHDGDGEEMGENDRLTTQHERLPEINMEGLSIGDILVHEPIKLLGTVESIIFPKDNVLVVRGAESAEQRVFNMLANDPPACTENRAVVGIITDVIALTSQPRYVIRYNDVDEVKALGVELNTKIYYFEQRVQHTSTEEIKSRQHTDASNKYDEEVTSGDEQDFSDDEKEAAHKAAQKTKRNKSYRVSSPSGSGANKSSPPASDAEADNGGSQYKKLKRPDDYHLSTTNEQPAGKRGSRRGGRGKNRGGNSKGKFDKYNKHNKFNKFNDTRGNAGMHFPNQGYNGPNPTTSHFPPPLPAYSAPSPQTPWSAPPLPSSGPNYQFPTYQTTTGGYNPPYPTGPNQVYPHGASVAPHQTATPAPTNNMPNNYSNYGSANAYGSGQYYNPNDFQNVNTSNSSQSNYGNGGSSGTGNSFAPGNYGPFANSFGQNRGSR